MRTELSEDRRGSRGFGSVFFLKNFFFPIFGNVGLQNIPGIANVYAL
jgi:hypothetical protein